jgi:hypothetical protein
MSFSDRAYFTSKGFADYCYGRCRLKSLYLFINDSLFDSSPHLQLITKSTNRPLPPIINLTKIVIPNPSSSLHFQIVIVEDNSTDQSRPIARKLSTHFKSLDIVCACITRLSFRGRVNWVWEVRIATVFVHAGGNS